jgi:hypothetical protein
MQETVPGVPLTIKEVLASHGDGSLGRNLNLGEDDEWVRTAVQNGSLIMIHDGSYQPELACDVCAAALVIFCTSTGRLGTATAAERTSPLVASNFRAEGIGGILAGLILHAAAVRGVTATHPVIIGCDNLGVISHAQHPPGSLPEKQPQADVVRALRAILSKTHIPFRYEHVYGHQDENTRFEQLPLLNQLNVLVDSYAKDALRRSLLTRTFTTSKWPFETVRVYKDRSKITSSFRRELTDAWGKTHYG